VFDIGLNRAVVLLAEKRAGKFAGRGAAVAPLKDLGAHPETGEPVHVMAGRFGPYVKSGKINATLPKGTAPGDMTLEVAVPLLAARALAAPARGKKAPAKKAAPKTAATKKPAAKKAPAKKAPAKKAAKA
jgi:DNA topoisomerase-1